MSSTNFGFPSFNTLDFRLHYEKTGDINKLYIAETASPVQLEIINKTSDSLSFSPPGNNLIASHDNCHFSMSWLSSVLTGMSELAQGPIPPDLIGNTEGWDIQGIKQGNEATFYFLKLGNPFDLPPQSQFTEQNDFSLTLHHLAGAPQHGAGTTNVELNCGPLLRNESGFPPIPTHKTIDLVHHQGKQQLPLHVGFVGANTVLNDGSSNRLHLQITNTLTHETTNPTLTFRPNAKFTLDFVGGPLQEAWALGTETEVHNIAVTTSHPGWRVDGHDISPSGSHATLAPGEAIDIQLDNIVTTHPSGLTNLYVRYTNVEPYGDGRMVCTVEKTPLLYRGQHVGINTIDLKAQLEVGGRVQAQQANETLFGVRIRTAFDNHGQHGIQHVGLTVENGNVGIGTANPVGKLMIQERIGSRAVDGGTLILDHENDEGHSSIVFRSKESPDRFYGYLEYQDPNRRNVQLQPSFYIGTTDGSLYLMPNNHLSIQPSIGNVGIRTGAPEATLDVRGDIKFGQDGDLYALGGIYNLRIIAGALEAGDRKSQAPGMMTRGYTSTWLNSGHYRVTFDTPFSGTPVVVTTLYTNQSINTPQVVSTKEGFEATSQYGKDFAFYFIAIGPR